MIDTKNFLEELRRWKDMEREQMLSADSITDLARYKGRMDMIDEVLDVADMMDKGLW